MARSGTVEGTDLDIARKPEIAFTDAGGGRRAMHHHLDHLASLGRPLNPKPELKIASAGRRPQLFPPVGCPTANEELAPVKTSLEKSGDRAAGIGAAD